MSISFSILKKKKKKNSKENARELNNLWRVKQMKQKKKRCMQKDRSLREGGNTTMTHQWWKWTSEQRNNMRVFIFYTLKITQNTNMISLQFACLLVDNAQKQWRQLLKSCKYMEGKKKVNIVLKQFKLLSYYISALKLRMCEKPVEV